jgi:hypothetical protein
VADESSDRRAGEHRSAGRSGESGGPSRRDDRSRGGAAGSARGANGQGRPGARSGAGGKGASTGRGGSGGTGGAAGKGRPAGAGRPGSTSRGGGSSGTSADRTDDRESRGGSRLAPKGPRLPEPRIPEGVTGKELDRSIHSQLRTLSKENAEGVAQHLVMVAAFLEAGDIDAALAHAETAVRRAGRVPAAREALGMVAYRQGDFARALTEFRTVRRLSGSSHLLPVMVDCERGLGRHGRALDLAATPEAATLEESERMELAIVVSGIRRDLGQEDAALLALQIPALRRSSTAGVFRLHYAYADVLLGLGREEEAREWFVKAMKGDTEGETDAVERLEELDGIDLDLGEDEANDLDGVVGGAQPSDVGEASGAGAPSERPAGEPQE